MAVAHRDGHAIARCYVACYAHILAVADFDGSTGRAAVAQPDLST